MDLVLLAFMGASEDLVLILVLDVFPQLLHFKDKSHKLLVSPLTFYNSTPTTLVSKTSLREILSRPDSCGGQTGSNTRLAAHS